MNRGSTPPRLEDVALFADLSDEERARLGEHFSEASYPSHTRVYRHGDTADFFYVILEGEVAIYRDEVGRPVQLQLRLGPGDYFGETGLFDGYKRSASARTSTDTRVARIEKSSLLSFLDEHPAVAIKMQIAAARRHTQNVAAALDLGVRSEVRIRLERRVSLELPFGARHSAVLENLSLGGLSLREAPASWQKTRPVQFVLVHGEHRLDLRGRISWREDDAVGVAFETPDSEHDQRVQHMLRRLLE